MCGHVDNAGIYRATEKGDAMDDTADEKLISQSKKEMENFIGVKLMIIIRELPLRKFCIQSFAQQRSKQSDIDFFRQVAVH